MNNRFKAFASLLVALMLIFSFILPSFAEASVFEKDAYATILTVSDLQGASTVTFDRFENIAGLMKADGLTTPDCVLSGGDYSKFMPSFSTPGVAYVRAAFKNVFPDGNEDSVVCVQGNHDMKSPGFTATGFYDMGSFCLYVINEDDFQWNQYLRSDSGVKKTAAKVDEALTKMISDGDTRPVIIITHVPLHHSDRSGGGDNMYSSYLFEVINKAAEKLDVVFLFGHNHSGAYDDYIGGAVNFLKAGDTIRLPKPDKKSETEYTEATLNFTYANYGYVGYSGNSTENGSTNVLSAGTIQICGDHISFVKYTEDGYYGTWTAQRKTTSDPGTPESYPGVSNPALYELQMKLYNFKLFSMIYLLFNTIWATIL